MGSFGRRAALLVAVVLFAAPSHAQNETIVEIGGESLQLSEARWSVTPAGRIRVDGAPGPDAWGLSLRMVQGPRGLSIREGTLTRAGQLVVLTGGGPSTDRVPLRWTRFLERGGAGDGLSGEGWFTPPSPLWVAIARARATRDFQSFHENFELPDPASVEAVVARRRPELDAGAPEPPSVDLPSPVVFGGGVHEVDVQFEPDFGVGEMMDAEPPMDYDAGVGEMMDAEPPMDYDAGVGEMMDSEVAPDLELGVGGAMDADIPPELDLGVGWPEAGLDSGARWPDLGVFPWPDGSPPHDPDAGPIPDGFVLEAGRDPDAGPAHVDAHVDAHVADAEPDGCADACTCFAPPNTTFSGSLSIPEEPFEKKVRLPFINKKVGVGFQASLAGSGGIGTCRNDCVSNFEVTGTGTASAAFGVIEVEAALKGTGSYERERCKVCDDMTCAESCQDIVCTTRGGSLDGEVTVNRTFGLPTAQWRKGPFGVKVGCNAKAGVTVSGGAGGTLKTPGPGGECEACDACTDVFVRAGLGLNGTGGCGLDLKAWRYERHFGCFDCLRAGGSVNGTLNRRFGEGASCNPARTCVKVTGQANAGANLNKCFGLRWFNVNVNCGVDIRGEAIFDSCGPDSRDGKLDLKCSVSTTWAGDCTKRCCRMCRRGKACGDSCISRSKRCRKPRGCACNNQ